ncbi:hypothetical protein VINI7043_09569 [Vibrio nigripulchritudo ATCC 27043]|uniref:zinc-dependent metalloprotease family protein n=1 Tax=Vibrio nigripulchritudo TaxID=28173 RepID=UPI00021C26B8|nr:zinc-dependent metalloprotease family protein [Vibrio nigripulchritudo]EGU56248.1 hypothetical protein VINI7043_09569 [Vibrio nigripulchritudo ATCC 27043]
MNKTLLAAVITSSLVAPSVYATTNIDILGVYTKATSDWFATEQNKTEHITQIQHRFNVGNQILKKSGLDVKVNLVGTKEYNYDSAPGRRLNQEAALDAITPSYKQDAIFSDIEQVRKEKGADMVALFRNLDVKNSPDYVREGNTISLSCGLAWVVPAFRWDASNTSWVKSQMYSHSYLNECGDDTFIHELGHNFGINHAREQYTVPPHTQNGTEKDAYGYGVNGKFATTMAYGFLFNVYNRSYTFSNPDTQCGDQACGVKDKSNATRAIGLTAPKIANIYQSKDGGTDTTDPVEPKEPQETKNVFSLESPVAVPDHTQIEIPLEVSYTGEVTEPTIALDIEHEFIGDISVRLIAPDNAYWVLKKANRSDRGKKFNVTFTLQDMQGVDITGQWKLQVTDHFRNDVGVVKNATLTLK